MRGRRMHHHGERDISYLTTHRSLYATHKRFSLLRGKFNLVHEDMHPLVMGKIESLRIQSRSQEMGKHTGVEMLRFSPFRSQPTLAYGETINPR